MRLLTLCLALAGTAAVAATPVANAQVSTIETERGPVDVSTYADGLVHPWGLTFLPDGGALVTERPGRLRHVSADGTLSDPIANTPDVVARNQGGLLDVAIDPAFEDNRLVYLTYAWPGEGSNTATAAARGRLSADNSRLEDVERIFLQEPAVPAAMHFGSRLVFDGEGHLYVTTGEHFTTEYRQYAQELDNHFGKVIRIYPDGSVPEDNPFVGQENAKPEIWSYGHRNIQAAAMNPETGVLWEIEHGPRGGDEINIVEPGVNYGWPLVSYGVNYNGTPVGTGKETMPGMRNPILHWTPVIAPSGMAFYDGDMFPEWQGDLLVGGLVARAIVRVAVDGDEAREVERIGTEVNRRIRDVEIGPDGAVYVLTDEADGAILRFAAHEES